MRSTLKSARYAQPPLDLDRLATDLAVDVVLAGTLLASKGRVRVSAELVTAPAGDVWWSHVTDASPDAVLELHDDLARQVLAALPLSWRDRRAAKAQRRQREGVRALPPRHAVARRGRRAAPGARVLRPAAWSAIPSSRRPGPSAAGSSACSASSRIRRCAPRPRRPSARRWPSTPTTAPRSTTSPSSRSTSAGSATRWRACSTAPGSGAPSRTSTRRWSTPAATAGCSTPRSPRTAPPSGSTRRWPTQRAAHLLPAGRLRAGARRAAPQQRSLRGAAARRDGPRATRPSPRPGARRPATPPFRCCAASPPRCGPASRARRDEAPRGHGGRSSDRALQRRRDAVLRGRGLRAASATPERAFAMLDRAVDAGFLCAAGLRARHLPGAAAGDGRVGAAGGPAHRGAGGGGGACSTERRGRALLGL